MPSGAQIVTVPSPIDGCERNIVLNQGTCEPIEEEKLYCGKGLQLKKYHFKDLDGKERAVEGVAKVKRPLIEDQQSTATADSKSDDTLNALCTIAVLKKQIMCDALILVKQYRAPLKSYTLEFPASVFDTDDNIKKSANIEIEDATGYTSTSVKHISPSTSLDPDITDGKVKLVSVTIDGDDPIQRTSPRNTASGNGGSNGNRGHGQIVEVIHVPINGLLDRLDKYSAGGLVIDSRVYAYAIGLKKGERAAVARYLAEAET
jgi:hypothetical protein